MDEFKAKKLENILQGKEIQGYKVISLINNGKSAAVFKAKDTEDNLYALKIFDNEMIERFGHEVQVDRIKKEIGLKDHNVPNLVRIYEGGIERIGEENYYFIVMEYISGNNLKNHLQSNLVDENFVLKLLSLLFKVTEKLIGRGFVHRDIKPENIMVDKEENIILMDLGVLKLIGNRDFTDIEQKDFIGTLRYAPPEFLLREESNDIKGWRAINIYQIGATLHDVIMSKELFGEYHPYARLVLAIKEDMPPIQNSKFSPELIQLTRDMLTKNSLKRLEKCSENRINKVINSDSTLSNEVENELKKALNKTIKNRAIFDNIVNINRSKEEKDKIQKRNIQTIFKRIKHYINALKPKGLFTSIELGKVFDISDMYKIKPNNAEGLQFIKMSGSLGDGFSEPIYLLVKCDSDSQSESNIEFAIFLLSPRLSQKTNLDKSLLDKLIGELGDSTMMGGIKSTYSIPFMSVFTGIFQHGDYAKESIQLEFIKLLGRAKDMMKNDVNQYLRKGLEVAPEKEVPIFRYNSPFTPNINKKIEQKKSIVIGRE